MLPLRMTYGDIKGSARLRTAISRLFLNRRPEDILITHGAIGANALVYQALVEHGDEVIAFVPTYQQHYSIPESLGATVRRRTSRNCARSSPVPPGSLLSQTRTIQPGR
jgi:aspartate/methionine/tyrosine aminotransferase